MGQISDLELNEIVKRVVGRTMRTATDSSISVPTALPVATNFSTIQSQSNNRVVAIGSDHGGYDLKELLKKELSESGYEMIDCGTYNRDACDYPDFALEVARLVSSHKAWRGIMIDGAGIGSCMVANKVPGVRAAMCYDYSTAVNSREHNDANLLTLGAGLIGVNLAKQIVKTWLTTEFCGGRHAKRVDKINAVENQFLKGR